MPCLPLKYPQRNSYTSLQLFLGGSERTPPRHCWRSMPITVHICALSGFLSFITAPIHTALFPSVRLSARLSLAVGLFIYLSVCCRMSVCESLFCYCLCPSLLHCLCLSVPVSLSICPSVSLSLCFVCLTFCLFVFVSMFVCLSLCLSDCLTVCLTV